MRKPLPFQVPKWSTKRQLIFGLALVLICSISEMRAQVEIAYSTTPLNGLLAELQFRFRQGEFGNVVTATQESIENIKLNEGHFDQTLVGLLRLNGDSQYKLAEYEKAISSYRNAMQIVHMTEGPFASEQIETAYRLADAYIAIGDGQSANLQYEFAYEIALNQHGEGNPRVLPQLTRLLEWYDDNRYFYHARILHEEAVTIMRSYLPATDIKLIEMTRVFAQGVKKSVFPTPRNGGFVLRGFAPNIPGYERHPFKRSHPYSMGRHALRNVLEQVEANPRFTENSCTTAMLELADWEQLFGQSQYAIQLYRRIWHQLENRPEFRDAEFAHPKLLYIRLPPSLIGIKDNQRGIVDLNLTISKRGRVIGRRTEYQNPRDTDREFRVRKALKFARFRPSFAEGEPTPTRDFPFSYAYLLH